MLYHIDNLLVMEKDFCVLRTYKLIACPIIAVVSEVYLRKNMSNQDLHNFYPKVVLINS